MLSIFKKIDGGVDGRVPVHSHIVWNVNPLCYIKPLLNSDTIIYSGCALLWYYIPCGYDDSSRQHHLKTSLPTTVPHQMGVTAEDVLREKASVNVAQKQEEASPASLQTDQVPASFAVTATTSEDDAPVERVAPGAIALASMIVGDLEMNDGGYPVMLSGRRREDYDSDE